MPDIAEQYRKLVADTFEDLLSKALTSEIPTASEIERARQLVRKINSEKIFDQIAPDLTEYQRQQFLEGVDRIDKIIDHKPLTEILPDVPEETIRNAGQPLNEHIKGLTDVVKKRIQRRLATMHVGKTTYQDAVSAMSEEMLVAKSRAKRIVRTEGKRLQNIGASQRISDVTQAVPDVPTFKVWKHSSGSSAPSAKGDKATKTRAGFTARAVRMKYEPRENHKAMHGVRVRPDEKFTLIGEDGVVYKVDHPHGEPLPAGEVVYCMCDVVVKIDRVALRARKFTQKKPTT